MDVLHERRKVLQNPFAFVEELAEHEERTHDRVRLENPYAHIDDVSRNAQGIQRFDGIAESTPVVAIRKARLRRSDLELEEIVRNLQLSLWSRRVELVGSDVNDPLTVLDPAIALRSLGYQVDEVESLGQFATTDGMIEVAGVIDKRRQSVQISTQFSRNVRAFTLAHELAHSVLHEGSGLHRDRALDGSSPVNDPDEREANRFATLFLMPAKQVRRVFEETFGFAPVRFDERATFGEKLPRGADVKRMAARRLASLTEHHGVPLVSLAVRFNVSIETMAIRLEELKLFLMSNNLSSRRK